MNYSEWYRLDATERLRALRLKQAPIPATRGTVRYYEIKAGIRQKPPTIPLADRKLRAFAIGEFLSATKSSGASLDKLAKLLCKSRARVADLISAHEKRMLAANRAAQPIALRVDLSEITGRT